MEPTTPKKQRPAQISLILRAGCGAYLIYLAWELRGALSQNPLFVLAVVLFLAVGAVLCFFSVRALVRGEYSLPYETEDGAEQPSDDAAAQQASEPETTGGTED